MKLTEDSLWQVETKVLTLNLPEEGFALESGKFLPEVRVAYEAYGDLHPDHDNVIFICHALTGDAHVAGYHGNDKSTRGWWDSMVGAGKGIDTNHYHVICTNVLGGCKGTTGPSTVNPVTGVPYGSSFPHITVQDIVNVNILLLKQLEIEKIAAVIGGSFGGMQAFEPMAKSNSAITRPNHYTNQKRSGMPCAKVRWICPYFPWTMPPARFLQTDLRLPARLDT